MHWSPSSGRSAPSTGATTFPAPSHVFVWQSPGVCAAVGVPAAALATPQTPLVHVRAAHSVSTPGQSAATRHCTQLPVPSQKVPPPWSHAAPAAAAG